ncbi:hypothetical protein SPRG_03334 [Saprolegnia parasitica CBS 223.65]|uniref:U-box domain-containing protein n=1 Tax=Saprolegnia parasitica (strain CBS 223.65) TaxID=695850 RepID=A0A067D037_SAPPC|nr:hypothetical protein SPRG_03334 [Saprolegnia parasitica CBS 223.65]KDO32116.1 hypothetical protein SPRG_03334 [Saprolegnia parasitica CBS 223.65]|eukprot:XP_012197301.1 hypothetical protein SPRG_03334 [Saprolegnia parasitica CBS 223.65]
MAPPSAYLCPITQEVMVDPVVTMDGHSYERSAIVRWIRSSQDASRDGVATSPLTNLPLRSTVLIPNLALKKAIAEYKSELDERPAKRYRFNVIIPRDFDVESVPELRATLRRCHKPSVRSAHLPRALAVHEMFFVSERRYAVGSNHVFLRLEGSGDESLRGLYVLAQAVSAPYTALVMEATLTRELAAYPSAPANTAVATDLRVQDPVTRAEYVRLDNCSLWLPVARLAPRAVSMQRILLCPNTAVPVYRNMYSTPASQVLETLPARQSIASSTHLTLGNACFARVLIGCVAGWIKVDKSDVIRHRPSPLAEEAAGKGIPVALHQGDYFLLALNEVQAHGGVRQQVFFFLPDRMAEAVNACIQAGRHLTHAALGPDGQWYLSSAVPGGSYGKCIASDDVPYEFETEMTPECLVAFGNKGRFLLLDKDNAAYYCEGLNFKTADVLNDDPDVITLGFNGSSGFFLKHTNGVVMQNVPRWVRDDVLEARPPRGYGSLLWLSLCLEEYVAIYEHGFCATNDVPREMFDALSAFYSRHHRLRNDRRQLIEDYDELIA